MKKRIVCLIMAVTLFLSGGLCSCSPREQKAKFSTHSMDYFDTVISITGYENSQEEFDTVAGEMIQLLGEYHRLYSIYHRFDGMENLCTVNELVDENHRTVQVDRRIIDLLLYSKEMYNVTKGITNIALGSVLSLWHEYRSIGKENPSQASLPPMDMLEAAAKHADISDVIIDEENNTVTLADPQMKIDVGAIAKGYATERVARHFEEKGITGYVLNVGGNVRTIGDKADGDKWTIGIENPNGGEYLAYLKLSGQSVVTSGSYQRFYYVDGKAYHHIIHPDTLMPAEGYLSVSVVCNDSGLGDALSTAIFCMPLQEGIALIESIADVEAMWIAEDGTKHFSSGWEKYDL